jgi:hypothetical protein
MFRKAFCVAAPAAMLLGLSIAGCGAPAPSDVLADSPTTGQVGRYQVVKVTDNGVVLLDTATGELYAAGPNDIKPFASRPQAERRAFGPLMKSTGTTRAETRKMETKASAPKDVAKSETKAEAKEAPPKQ